MEEDPVQLIRAIARRDREAFQRFYDRYSPLAYTFAMRILRSKPDAEDLLQEVFLQIWNQAGSYDSRRGRPEAWIITITKSRAIDKIRSVRRRERGGTVLEEHSAVRQAEADARASGGLEVKVTVAAVLEQLPDIHRQALELAYFEGLTQTEIAERLEIPLGTVKTRIRDGLEKLRSGMKRENR